MSKIATIKIEAKCRRCGDGKAYLKYYATGIEDAATWVRDTLATGDVLCRKCAGQSDAKRKNSVKPHPKRVTVIGPDGAASKLPVADIIDHNREIIDDNVAFCIQHEHDYEVDEVDEVETYQRDALKDLSELKRTLNEIEDPVVTIERMTDLYVVYSRGEEA